MAEDEHMADDHGLAALDACRTPSVKEASCPGELGTRCTGKRRRPADWHATVVSYLKLYPDAHFVIEEMCSRGFFPREFHPNADERHDLHDAFTVQKQGLRMHRQRKPRFKIEDAHRIVYPHCYRADDHSSFLSIEARLQVCDELVAQGAVDPDELVDQCLLSHVGSGAPCTALKEWNEVLEGFARLETFVEHERPW
jgi:hypothetical protein